MRLYNLQFFLLLHQRLTKFGVCGFGGDFWSGRDGRVDSLLSVLLVRGALGLFYLRVAFLDIVGCDIELEYIPLMPLTITLRLNKLHNLLLLGLDAGLLLPEPIKLGMPFRNLLSLLIRIQDPGVRILTPDIEHRDADIAA